MKPAGKYAVALLLVIVIVPFVIVCFYAFPFADDFCFAWTASENISFAQKFLNQYLFWNGRYTADVLANLHPLVWGDIFSYQVALAISLAATPLVLYWLVREFVEGIDGVLTALYLTLLYLNHQPNITEGIYWFIGVANYHVANLLFVAQLTLFIRILRQPTALFATVMAGVLLIVAIGCNEIGALLFPCFYLITYFHTKRKVVLLFLLVATVASAFVFFSPGNLVRAQLFNHRFDVLHSLVYSVLQTARFLMSWWLNIPFVLISILVLMRTPQMRITVNYRLLAISMLSVLLMGSFLPYIATGVLGQHRTINFVYFFFLLLWAIFLLALPERISVVIRQIMCKRKYLPHIFMVLAIVLIVVSGNSRKIYADFITDKFGLYKKSFIARHHILLNNPNAEIETLHSVPSIFNIVDAQNDTTHWVDKCMKHYYWQKQIEREGAIQR